MYKCIDCITCTVASLVLSDHFLILAVDEQPRMIANDRAATRLYVGISLALAACGPSMWGYWVVRHGRVIDVDEVGDRRRG